MARKVALSLLVIGLMAAIIGFGTFAAFSDTTTNEENFITVGSVELEDNATSPLYELSDAVPADAHESCIEVTYVGSMPASVELYSTTGVALGALGQYVDLTIEVGAQPAVSFQDCTDFVADGSAIFDGTLQQFVDTHTAGSGGVVAVPDGQAAWNTNDSLVYRFTVEVQDDPAANGLGTDLHQFTWRATDA